ncbi:hypothetical protein GGU10DRAFT_129458 [Lentinula aff. detonsa]|uniref:Uncharacterized protein n=1 Tax=Lentinula aff. detonsa TaxID=2804958 RepID=A0AA38NTD9_9AGAR|nr:hypothetical protein GGU10DRAFT_129458 [Lentinula aff. detonsa]
MSSRLSRRSSSHQPIYDSFERMPNSRRTKTVHRLSQLVHKSRTLLSFIWLKDINNQGQTSCPQLVNERNNRQRSSSVLDFMQPRPSLPTDRISRPYRPGSCPFSRNSQQSLHSHSHLRSHLHSHSHPHGRQISRSEVTVCSTPTRPPSQHPPRFASVVRRKAPRYSTIARPTHSTVLLSSEMDNGESLAVVNFNGMTGLDSPPPYSQFDLGLPRTGYVE